MIEREPPRRKAWQTMATPQLPDIGPYRMGFTIARHRSGSELTVFIDYARPAAGVGRWLGRLLGDTYARWCVRRIATDASLHFDRSLATQS